MKPTSRKQSIDLGHQMPQTEPVNNLEKRPKNIIVGSV